MASKSNATAVKFRQMDESAKQKVDGDKKKENITEYGAGDILFNFGDRGGDLYFIKEGDVEVFRPQGEEEYHFCNVTAGEVLGVATLLNQGKRAATARAITDVKVQIVPNEKFNKLIRDCPKWLSYLFKDLGFRLETSNRHYISSSSQLSNQNSNRSILKISSHIARSLTILGRHDTVTIDSKKVALLESVVGNLSFIGRYSPLYVDKAAQIFRDTKLIEGELIDGRFYLSKDDFTNLLFYVKIVEEIIDIADSNKVFFSLADLSLLSSFSIAMHKVHGESGRFQVSLDDIPKKVNDFSPELTDKCLARKLFEKGKESTIQGDLVDFDLKVRCLDSMLRFKKELDEKPI